MLRVIYDQPNSQTAPAEAPVVVTFGAGFHPEEWEDSEAFRWMGLEGVLEFPPSPEVRFLEMGVFSPFYDLSQVLAVEAGGERHALELVHGWAQVSVPCPPAPPARACRSHACCRRSTTRATRGSWASGCARRACTPRAAATPTSTASTPTPCTTCARCSTARPTSPRPRAASASTSTACATSSRPASTATGTSARTSRATRWTCPFTRETLDEWGDLFDNAANLVNCSIGEPFMMKNFDELLDAFGEQGKSLEMATNGQILTDKNVQKLLGRRVHLYISLDAATPDTYAKLRNDKFDRILVNLRRLIAAKGGRAGLPKVHMVFMPMRVNVHELPDVRAPVRRPRRRPHGAAPAQLQRGHRARLGARRPPLQVRGRAAALGRAGAGRAAARPSCAAVTASSCRTRWTSAARWSEGFPAEYERGRREGAAIGGRAPGGRSRRRRADRARAGLGGGACAGARSRSRSPRPSAPRPSLGEEQASRCAPSPGRASTSCAAGVSRAATAPRRSPACPSTARPGTARCSRTSAATWPPAASTEYCLSAEACPIVRKSKAAEVLTRGERAFLRARASGTGSTASAAACRTGSSARSSARSPAWCAASPSSPGDPEARIPVIAFRRPEAALAAPGLPHDRHPEHTAPHPSVRSPRRRRRPDGRLRRLGDAGPVLRRDRGAPGGARGARGCSTSPTWARSASPAPAPRRSSRA